MMRAEVVGGHADGRSGRCAGGGVRDHPSAQAEDVRHGIARPGGRLLEHLRRRRTPPAAHQAAEVEVLAFEQPARRGTGGHDGPPGWQRHGRVLIRLGDRFGRGDHGQAIAAREAPRFLLSHRQQLVDIAIDFGREVGRECLAGEPCDLGDAGARFADRLPHLALIATDRTDDPEPGDGETSVQVRFAHRITDPSSIEIHRFKAHRGSRGKTFHVELLLHRRCPCPQTGRCRQRTPSW